MSTITQEITRLQTAKTNLKTSIEAKGVTVSADATLDQYPALVDSIPSGGGGGVEEKDVNFYDYDGTCLYSYTKDEFLALNEMPANPDHSDEGLISDGWTGTLEEAKHFVSKCGFCDLGQYYKTNDEKVKYYIVLDNPAIIQFYFQIKTNSSITVDWGDNTEPTTFTNSTSFNTTHEYSSKGEFTVIITVNSGTFCLATNGSSYVLPGGKNSIYSNYIKKIIVSNQNILFSSYAFNLLNCPIIVPKNINHEFNFNTYQNYLFPICILPHYSINAFNAWRESFSEAFDGCLSRKLIAPLSLSEPIYNGGNNLFRNTICERAIIPEGVITIGTQSFRNSRMKIVVLPATITDIDYGFTYCNLGKIIILATVPPNITSSDTNNLKNIETKIYVPAESVEAYKAATNWSDIADQIFPIPTE